jgi:hypothetical protein
MRTKLFVHITSVRLSAAKKNYSAVAASAAVRHLHRTATKQRQPACLCFRPKAACHRSLPIRASWPQSECCPGTCSRSPVVHAAAAVCCQRVAPTTARQHHMRPHSCGQQCHQQPLCLQPAPMPRQASAAAAAESAGQCVLLWHVFREDGCCIRHLLLAYSACLASNREPCLLFRH